MLNNNFKEVMNCKIVIGKLKEIKMLICFFNDLIVLVWNFCFSNSPCNKANMFLGVIEYELNNLLGASHLVNCISVHIPFDL